MADRFHLLKNLGEALEGVLARHLAAHRKLQTETAIAAQVGISHATVSRWLSTGTFPEQKPRPRSTSVDPYLPQLVERWKEGLQTVAELHRELVAKGYSHQYYSVYRRLARSFPAGAKKRCTRSLPAGPKQQETADQPPQPPILARQAMFLFLRHPQELEIDEQETLTLLRSLHAEVDQAYELVQQFAETGTNAYRRAARRVAFPCQSKPDTRVAGLCDWSNARQSSGQGWSDLAC